MRSPEIRDSKVVFRYENQGKTGASAFQPNYDTEGLSKNGKND